MGFEVKDTKAFLEDMEKFLLTAACSALVASVIELLFLPKQTKIIVDGNVPAELVSLGKKGRPQAVYVSSKKRRFRIFPVLLFLGTALLAGEASKHVDGASTDKAITD